MMVETTLHLKAASRLTTQSAGAYHTPQIYCLGLTEDEQHNWFLTNTTKHSGSYDCAAQAEGTLRLEGL
jgi:hypothetical protein